MKKVLISFGSQPFYKAQERLKKSALPYFDQVINYHADDIDIEFKIKHQDLLSSKRGAGYWLWKPYFILKTLNTLNKGDFCFYTDASSYFIKSPKNLFGICKKRNGILLFDNGTHTNRTWTKRDCFVLMGMDEPRYYDTPQCSAGYQLYQKNKGSVSFIEEFLKYCSNYSAISDSNNSYGGNLPGFKDHRHDQSVLSLMAIKKGIPLYRDPSQWGNWHKSGEKGQILVNNRDALKLKF